MNKGIFIESGSNIFNHFLDNDCSSDYSLNDFKSQNLGFEVLPHEISEENKKIPENKIKYFKITKVKRCGRKRKRDNKNTEKSHSKYEFDNIIRKVQVHFHKFLISFVNEILINFGINKKFLSIDYKHKKDVKKERVDELKKLEIGSILSRDLSTKYKKQYKIGKDKNEKLYSEVIKYDSIKKILSEPYINIFRNFYYKNKRNLNEYNLNIKLSKNVKTYHDFLKDFSKESEYIEKIEKFVKKCYLPKKIFINN